MPETPMTLDALEALAAREPIDVTPILPAEERAAFVLPRVLLTVAEHRAAVAALRGQTWQPTREMVSQALGELSRHTVHCSNCYDKHCYGNPTYDMVLDLLESRGWIREPAPATQPRQEEL